MNFVEAHLRGAFLIVPEPFLDSRGFFERTYCTREFATHGIQDIFVQHSLSFSALRGTLRGMHLQRQPYAEAKVVSCTKGAILDVIVDARRGSKTFRQWKAFELSAGNRHQLYVPVGFAHGFQTLEDNTEVNYLISNFYQPDASTGLRYDDPSSESTGRLRFQSYPNETRAGPLSLTDRAVAFPRRLTFYQKAGLLQSSAGFFDYGKPKS